MDRDARGERLTDALTRTVMADYLAELCAELGTPPLLLGDDGEASLVGRYRGREVAVSFALREQRQLLLLMSPVLEKWKGDVAALMAMLLTLNLSPDDTLGAAFAVSPGDGVVRLTISLVGPTVHYAIFRATFLRLFALSAAWRENFERNPVLAKAQQVAL